MLQIIGGLILQAIGGGFIYAMIQARGNEGFLFMALGVAASLGGLYVTLRGFRKFFLEDMMTELRRIAGPAAVVTGFKKCGSCAQIIRAEAKLCPWCGRDAVAE
jgi:hypothetical protein